MQPCQMFNKPSLSTSIKDRHVKSTLSASIYSFDDFNTKVKIADSQKRKYWDAPQIKGLKLVITKHHTFMASDSFFIALGIPSNQLERNKRTKSTLAPD